MKIFRVKFARVVAGAVFTLVVLMQTQAQAALLTTTGQALLEAHLGEGSLILTNGATTSLADYAADWHADADGIGRTFTLIEITSATKNNNSGGGSGGTFSGPMIIGGYNPFSWNSSGTYNEGANRDAFLFNLTLGLFLDQLPGSIGDKQTFNHTSLGPTFGGGHDLQVRDSLESGSLNPYSYSNGVTGLSDFMSVTLNQNVIGTLGYWDIQIGGIETYTIANVSAIPLPAALPLFVSGLLGLGVMARRRKKTIEQ